MIKTVTLAIQVGRIALLVSRFYKNALRRGIVPKSNRRHRRCQPSVKVRIANMSGVFSETKATLRSAAAAC
jgi:hypothetical protein